MKNIRIFLSEKLSFSVVKCSVYFNRRVFIMHCLLSSVCTVNPLNADTRYNDKIRYNDNLNVKKYSLKR